MKILSFAVLDAGVDVFDEFHHFPTDFLSLPCFFCGMIASAASLQAVSKLL